jgi:hypothetical protein
VISIPPSHQFDVSKDKYLEEVQEAMSLFSSHPEGCPCCDGAGAERQGMCLLISSTAVYGNQHEIKNEFSAVDDGPAVINPRAKRFVTVTNLH